MVKYLNAQYVGGQTATGLAATGGEEFTPPGTNTSLGTNPAVVQHREAARRNLLRDRDRGAGRGHR